MTKKTVAVGEVQEPLLSADGERVDGALTAPKADTITLAGKMRGDELYVNVKPLTMGSPYKMFRYLGKEKDGEVKVTMYADTLKEWLTILVKPTWEFTTDERYLHAMTKPIEKSKEERRKRAAHLPKFQKTKPDPDPSPSDPKRGFKAKIGNKLVIFDAGDGSTLATMDLAGDYKVKAKELKRELVSSKQASPYAFWVFVRAWHSARVKP